MNETIERLKLEIEFCELTTETLTVCRALLEHQLQREVARQRLADQWMESYRTFPQRLGDAMSKIPVSAEGN